ncbi:HAMP domain-containing sensor histidine kinase [Streptosporangium sp. NPDC048865]|uniref:sensor histidine kinase n=1 Tax=Streptosporangium sp. NPDC048865 TaxID=3155766 RepID=UPI00342E4BF6
MHRDRSGSHMRCVTDHAGGGIQSPVGPPGATAARQAAQAWRRQFAADASHELRTPVAGLRVELEEALMHPEQTDLRELVTRALKSVNRLESIVSDLLTLARVQAVKTEECEDFDLSELVGREVLRRSDRLPVRLQLMSGVIVRAVPLQIVRVLTALLDNAQQHATYGVRVEVDDDDGHAELVVIDDGEGVAEADRERIFEQFTRTDSARSRDRGGSGLGLAIAREIALAHRGSLDVRETASGGACFTLRLPSWPDRGGKAAGLGQDAGERPPARPR